MATLTNDQIAQVRQDAHELAAARHRTLTRVGDGLYRLDGEDGLLAAHQVVALLKRKPRKDKGVRRRAAG